MKEDPSYRFSSNRIPNHDKCILFFCKSIIYQLLINSKYYNLVVKFRVFNEPIFKFISTFYLCFSFNICCDDTLITDIPIPDENVSYSQHIQPLFNTHCNNTTCHNSEDRAGGLSLEFYGEFRNSPFLIISGAPEESLLYLTVSGQYVTIMPPQYGSSIPLNDNQIAGIKTWIEEGAEAN